MGLLDQEFEIDETESNSSLKDTLAGIGGCLLYLLFGVGGITLLVLVIRGVPWIADNIYPWVSLICAGFVILILPISMILAFIRKTREVSSIGFLLSSFALGINLWLSCLILAYIFAGSFWMIVGLLFGGIGVVPIALIATLISAEWSASIQILVGFGLVFGTRALSVYLSEYDEGTKERVEEETNRLLKPIEEPSRVNVVVERFGKFLEEDKPLISDIEALPFSKREIESALLSKEQELCDIANECVRTGNKENLPELEKLIGAVGSSRVFLKSYTEIDAEDRDNVDYFNGYESEDEIPQEERNEFGLLRAKYMTKWLREDGNIELENEDSVEGANNLEESDYEVDETDNVVDYFLGFIDDQPLIHDVDNLYFSRDEIDRALIRKEHELHAFKFSSEQARDYNKAKELEKFLGSICSARELLASYVEIDPDDHEDVDHFNNFTGEHEVPREEKAKFETLRAKYLLKWKDAINQSES